MSKSMKQTFGTFIFLKGPACAGLGMGLIGPQISHSKNMTEWM